MRDFILVAKAISDPTRVRILKMLEPGPLCVCHITERLGLAQSTVSKHLAQLRYAGAVTLRKRGLWAYYSLEKETINSYNQAFLALLRSALNDDPQIAADREAPETTSCSQNKVA